MTRVIGRRRWLARPAQPDDHRLVRRECEPRVAHMRCMRAHSVSRRARSTHIASIEAAGDERRDGRLVRTHAELEHFVQQGERLVHAPRAPAAVREQPAQQRRVRPHVGPQWVGIVAEPRKDCTRTPELPIAHARVDERRVGDFIRPVRAKCAPHPAHHAERLLQPVRVRVALDQRVVSSARRLDSCLVHLDKHSLGLGKPPVACVRIEQCVEGRQVGREPQLLHRRVRARHTIHVACPAISLDEDAEREQADGHMVLTHRREHAAGEVHPAGIGARVEHDARKTLGIASARGRRQPVGEQRDRRLELSCRAQAVEHGPDLGRRGARRDHVLGRVAGAVHDAARTLRRLERRHEAHRHSRILPLLPASRADLRRRERQLRRRVPP